MPSYARQNGKPCPELAALAKELEATAAKYRPMLEGLGILDDLLAYQKVMLFVWLWKYDKGIEDSKRGVMHDVRFEWDD